MITGPEEEPFEIDITDSLDLHAFSPKDVKAVTIAYLEEARKKGFRVVRLIHGKGIGGSAGDRSGRAGGDEFRNQVQIGRRILRRMGSNHSRTRRKLAVIDHVGPYLAVIRSKV